MSLAADRREHWQRVYRDKGERSVSWYRAHLDCSLQMIDAAAAGAETRILDVGGGASTLADDLLARGFEAVTVLDIAPDALARARRRLRASAGRVTWIEGDILAAELAADSVDIWHDRAVLHFLTDEADRRAYVGQLRHAVAPGGHAIIATFAPEGPERCSGLPVRRYDAEALQALVGASFSLRRSVAESHQTPSGSEQLFTYCWLQRNDPSSPQTPP